MNIKKILYSIRNKGIEHLKILKAIKQQKSSIRKKAPRNNSFLLPVNAILIPRKTWLFYKRNLNFEKTLTSKYLFNSCTTYFKFTPGQLNTAWYVTVRIVYPCIQFNGTHKISQSENENSGIFCFTPSKLYYALIRSNEKLNWIVGLNMVKELSKYGLDKRVWKKKN